MRLLVDIGNSRVKWAFAMAGSFVAEGDALLDDAVELRTLLECGRSPEEIRVANVAGAEAGARIAASLQQHFRISPILACSAATGAGVSSGYTEPRRLGVDRWLALCAAFARYGGPVCVVDAGTATTVDLVTGSGQHQGGLILPGLALMQSALGRRTGDLARLAATESLADLEPTSGDHPILLGRDTASAIRYGALQATASLVRDCMVRFSSPALEGSGPPLLVITGGGAPALRAELAEDRARSAKPWPGFRVEYRPLLVLEGLALDPLCFNPAP